MPGNERYIVPLITDADGGFLWFPLDCGPVRLEIVPQLHTPLSTITANARQRLIEADSLSSSDRDFSEDISISGAVLIGIPIFSISVEVSEMPAGLGVDGVFGFNFFARFAQVHFVFPPHRMILIDP